MRSRSSDSARNQKVSILYNPLIIEFFQSSPPLSCGSWIINPQELVQRVSSSVDRSEKNNQSGEFTYSQPFSKTIKEESLDDYTLEQLLQLKNERFIMQEVKYQLEVQHLQATAQRHWQDLKQERERRITAEREAQNCIDRIRRLELQLQQFEMPSNLKIAPSNSKVEPINSKVAPSKAPSV